MGVVGESEAAVSATWNESAKRASVAAGSENERAANGVAVVRWTYVFQAGGENAENENAKNESFYDCDGSLAFLLILTAFF